MPANVQIFDGRLFARSRSLSLTQFLEFQAVSVGAASGQGTANASDDDGWAEHNASRVRHLFAKLGFRDEASDLDFSVTLADNTLNGAQTLPLSFLDRPREPYTYPDTNQSRTAFLVAKCRVFRQRRAHATPGERVPRGIFVGIRITSAGAQDPARRSSP